MRTAKKISSVNSCGEESPSKQSKVGGVASPSLSMPIPTPQARTLSPQFKGRTKLSFIRPTQSGFTIIESLMAMIVAAILLAAIGPVMVLATATRLQARRVELSTQAARTYMDGVRSGTILPPASTVTLPDNLDRDDFANAPAPNSSAVTSSCAANTYCDSPGSLYCVDIDGDGVCNPDKPADLVVQGFRSVTAAVSDPEKGYVLGVRVYTANAFSGGGTLATQEERQRKQSTFSAGVGDRKAPLMEITTEVSGSGSKFSDYCTRLGGC